MEMVLSTTVRKILTNLLPPLIILIVAIVPRAYDLPRFVTADEAKWVYRSAQFLAAFLTGDYAGTNVNLTPAVTTTWLGSLGLVVYYYLHQADINLPFVAWLQSLPPYRAELDPLVATRWPMVLLGTFNTLLIYYLVKRLIGPTIATISAIFVALSPHIISLDRVLGHDAPTAIFSALSLLLLLKGTASQQNINEDETTLLNGRFLNGVQSLTKISRSTFITLLLSGLTAGLAFLSKAPAFFLIPFTAFYLGIWLFTPSLVIWLKRIITIAVPLFMAWGIVAYLTFILIWPAAWVEPLGAPYQVIENAFLSATDTEEAQAETFWLVPELGIFYYPVYGLFKLSPLVLIGLAGIIIVIWQQRSTLNLKLWSSGWLLAFAFLFILFMTVGSKRSPRYILPIFPALAIVAAVGWQGIFKRYGPAGNRLQQGVFQGVLGISACLILLPYMPYYFSYYNPLLGGATTATRLVKIGWGEGLDQVGRYLQRTQPNSRVGTAYASTIAPYFGGRLSAVTSERLDRLVLYKKQVQSGNPSPILIGYFAHQQAMFTVELNGIHYADVYTGPTLTMLPLSTTDTLLPIAYRPLALYGRISETLSVDVVWSQLPSTEITTTVSLSAEVDDPTSLAQASATAERWLNGLVVSQHELPLPNELSRDIYTLRANGHLLGQVELRRFTNPPSLSRLNHQIVFNQEIALTGYQFIPAEDYIGLILAWQSLKPNLPDYTMFAQLIDLETNTRIAGFDSQPVQATWPTSEWVKDEVVIDEPYIAMPPNLPDGYYKVIIGIYQADTGVRLTLPDGRDHWEIPWRFIRGKRTE